MLAVGPAVGAGDLGRFHAEPLRQRQPPIIGQLTARILSNRGDDANRTRLQRRKVRFIVGNRCKGVAEPEIHVPLHLRHPLTHLGCWLARWWGWRTTADARLHHELPHGWADAGRAVRLHDVYHGRSLLRGVWEKRRRA